MTNSPETVDDYTRVSQQVENLLTLNDNEFSQSVGGFVSARVAELIEQKPPKTELSGLSGNYKGFLRPDSEVIPYFLGTGFYVNDDDIYNLALRHARDFRTLFAPKLENDPEKLYRNVAIWATQYAQQEYFGNLGPSEEGKIARQSLLARGEDIEEENVLPTSIAEFKNVAMCAERAAVANNILRFFGMNPVFVMGELRVGDQKSALHAYLVFKNSNGQDTIYDPTNPSKTYKNESGVITYPAAYVVGNEFLGTLGASAEFVHKTQDQRQGNDQVKEESYVFLNNPFHSDVYPE